MLANSGASACSSATRRCAECSQETKDSASIDGVASNEVSAVSTAALEARSPPVCPPSPSHTIANTTDPENRCPRASCCSERPPGLEMDATVILSQILRRELKPVSGSADGKL